MTSVRISAPLRPARVLDRPNRMTVRVVVEPEQAVVEASVPSAGRLPGLLYRDAAVWVRDLGEDRRPRWSLSVARTEGGELACLEPGVATELVAAAVQDEALPELAGLELARRDVPFGTSRFALELGNLFGQQTYVDVEAAPLVENGVALFPDAPNPRAVRQVRSLTRVVAQRQAAGVLVLVVPRIDARAVMPARPIDPEYYDAFREAVGAGVRVIARRCRTTLEELVLGVPVEVKVPAGTP